MSNLVALPRPLQGFSLRAARQRLFVLMLAAFTALVLITALRFGAMPLNTEQVIGALLAPLGIDLGGLSSIDREVVWSLRAPRIALGFFVGAGLSVAGAAMQGMFRNPLADPGLIGVSAGASAGAATVIILFDVAALSLLGSLAWLGVSLAAFAGGLGATALVYAIGTGGSRIAVMLLAGIALNSIVGALTGVLVFVADDAQLRTWTFWTLGSVGDASWSMVAVAAAGTAIALGLLYPCRHALNVWLLGEDHVHHLGFSVRTTRRLVVVATALAVSVAVAVAGVVSFVGLVIPHMVRLVIGSDHRVLIPASCLLGGSLLVVADVVARTVVAPAELPLSVITALLGGPLFLGLIVRGRNQWSS